MKEITTPYTDLINEISLLKGRIIRDFTELRKRLTMLERLTEERFDELTKPLFSAESHFLRLKEIFDEEYVQRREDRFSQLSMIIEEVFDKTDISKKSRKIPYPSMKMIFCFVANQQWGYCHSEIGDFLGLDRSTVCYNISELPVRMKYNHPDSSKWAVILKHFDIEI